MLSGDGSPLDVSCAALVRGSILAVASIRGRFVREHISQISTTRPITSLMSRRKKEEEEEEGELVHLL